MLLKMRLLKKTIYHQLAAKVNNIDTSDFVLKTKHQTDKAELEKKFLILAVLLKKQTTIRNSLNLKTKSLMLVI